MTIPTRFKEELRNRLTLSELVGRKVRLARAGREFKGCCPFHNEKTPSFYVNDDKQFYHCFGCGAHGDVIGFSMQHDNLSFIEAIETLASEAGLEVPKASPQEIKRAKEEKSLYSLLEDATRWMEAQLRDPSNQQAYRYITERGNSEEQLNSFRVGYAPHDGQAIRKALTAMDYTDSQMIEAGVLRTGKAGREPYAFFRERIMFPVQDIRGRVVAFGGRTLPDHLLIPNMGDYVPAKYMNSSDTTLFDKGRILYGMPRARQAAIDGQPLVVVEGYVDVMACIKAGYHGAMAPMGTALTEDQIAVLWRMIPDDNKTPILCFDGDSAGQRAASRAAERLIPMLKAGHSAAFAFLPEGQDPDSLVNSQGKKALEAVLSAAIPLVDFLWQSYTAGQSFNTPESRAGLSKKIEEEVNRIPDRDVQHYYRQALRDKIRQSFNTYEKKWNKGGSSNKSQLKPSLSLKKPAFIGEEVKLLAAMINHPSIFDQFEEEIGLLVVNNTRIDALRQEMIAIISENPEKSSDFLQNTLSERGYDSELRGVLSQSLYELARFARPNADVDEVCESWRGIYTALCERSAANVNRN